MKKYSGFTILELMMTLGLVAILTTIGVPYFGDVIKNNRLSTQINALVGHLAYARSEAVLRNQPVILCASGNMTTCVAGARGWADGWLLFLDGDNSSNLSAGDTILRVKQPLEGVDTTLTTSMGTDFIYDSRGFSGSGAGTFSLCDDRGIAKMKSISISNTGRVRQGGAAAC